MYCTLSLCSLFYIHAHMMGLKCDLMSEQINCIYLDHMRFKSQYFGAAGSILQFSDVITTMLD